MKIKFKGLIVVGIIFTLIIQTGCSSRDKQIYDTGDTYEGETEGDLKSGEGIYTYEKGDKYEGTWKDDLPNGKGTYTWANGDIFVGEWKDGNIEGKGIKTC